MQVSWQGYYGVFSPEPEEIQVQKPNFIKSAKMAAGLLFQGRVTLTFDQILFHYRDVPLKKRINFIIQGIQLFSRSVNRAGIPVILQIEPSNICNLHCLTCATGADLVTRQPACMSFEMFRQIIDQVKDYVYLLVFWSWGEPFMNRDAPRMIRYAKEQGLLVHTSTNGHFFSTREEARSVIESGLDSLIVAVDGLDQATYEKYRQGGSLEKVIRGIENLVTERASLGYSGPRITLRFIVMKHNEHQVVQVENFARNLGVDAYSFRSALARRSRVDYGEELIPKSPEFQRYNYKASQTDGKGRQQLNNYCHRPYANLTIFSNGDVVACENDFNAAAPLGNASKQRIGDIISSGKARNFFKVFSRDPVQFDFCRECESRYSTGHTPNIQTNEVTRGS